MEHETIPGIGKSGTFSWGRIAKHMAILFVLLAVWEYVTATGIADELMFPQPTEIVLSVWPLYGSPGIVWYHLWVTMATVLAGFVVGTVLGIVLAALVGMSESTRRYLQPYIIILEATPRIAMGPLVLAWLGFGFGAKLAIVTLVCFFAPFVNTLTGILSANEPQIELMKSMGASKWQILTKAMVPDAMPLIMAGIRLAMASALGGALVAEFISSNDGMGVLMQNLTAVLNMPAAFATLLSLTIVGFILYRLMEMIEGTVVFWQNDDGMRRASRRREKYWRSL